MERNVELKVTYIGVGNGGTQIGIKAYDAGFNTAIINTSQRDLAEDVLPKEILSYIIGSDGRGTGKNRNLAKEYFKDDLVQLLNHQGISEKISNADIVVVCAAMGGGTGSGIAPFLCNRISRAFTDKTVIFCGVLPKLSESPQSQYNSLECMNEVHKLNLPYMLVDLDKYSDMDDHSAHEKVADHVVKALSVLRGDKMLSSQHGMIDERDELTIINTPGYMAIYNIDKITKANVEMKSMSQMVLENMKKCAAVNCQYDKIINYMGVMVSAPEEFADPLQKANFSDLQTAVGIPYDTFYNPHINDGSKGEVTVIMSGMSLPQNRLQTINDMLAEFENSRKQKSLNVDTEFSSFGKGSITDKSAAKPQKGSIDLDDIPDFL